VTLEASYSAYFVFFFPVYDTYSVAYQKLLLKDGFAGFDGAFLKVGDNGVFGSRATAKHLEHTVAFYLAPRLVDAAGGVEDEVEVAAVELGYLGFHFLEEGVVLHLFKLGVYIDPALKFYFAL
jgi:hypothetical protein